MPIDSRLAALRADIQYGADSGPGIPSMTALDAVRQKLKVIETSLLSTRDTDNFDAGVELPL